MMEPIVKKSNSYKEAEDWDIRQQTEMTPYERRILMI